MRQATEAKENRIASLEAELEEQKRIFASYVQEVLESKAVTIEIMTNNESSIIKLSRKNKQLQGELDQLRRQVLGDQGAKQVPTERRTTFFK